MLSAIQDGKRGVLGTFRTIHRLQEEMLERKALKTLRLSACLPKYELQLVAALHDERGARFGAYAHPINSLGHGLSTVRFDGDAKTASM